MSWHKQIDNTYLINLDKRPDRLLDSTEVLNRYGVEFDRFAACEHAIGCKGIRQSLITLFEDALQKGYDNILVFEDDIEFTVAPDIFNDVMGDMMNELPVYDMVFLGANMIESAHVPYSSHLTKLRYNQEHSNIVVANHAMLYSRNGIKECLLALNTKFDKYGTTDMCLWQEVCSQGFSYAVRPLLASQRAGYSDIENRVTDYERIIKMRYGR